MNIKNIMCGIFCVFVSMTLASADTATDTEKIKEACQKNAQTLWVENTQRCIPVNPCDTSKSYGDKYEKYCNRTFAKDNVDGDSYKFLVEVYAKKHGLDCMPKTADSAFVGQDFVVCQGNDVMVFEFDDISDAMAKPGRLDYEKVCRALGTKYEDGRCAGAKESDCDLYLEIAKKYDDVNSWLTGEHQSSAEHIMWLCKPKQPGAEDLLN